MSIEINDRVRHIRVDKKGIVIRIDEKNDYPYTINWDDGTSVAQTLSEIQLVEKKIDSIIADKIKPKNKYERRIIGLDKVNSCTIDVYCVLEAFNVTCPARQHAIKKLLCVGLKGKGNVLQDLHETLIAVERAIQLEEVRNQNEV